MGDRIRSFDWSATPLGPVESWSAALRTTVSLLLANRFPMLLWWGPHYIQLYNDPYRPIPGSKHPDKTLGQPASKCWAEIWHVIGPLIDTPFHGGAATWMDDILLEIDRHGFLEESHFTIAYSPVPDETMPNGIGGVLATVHEITEKIIGERRVAALRDMGTELIEAESTDEVCRKAIKILCAHDKDVPFAMLYLIDDDQQQARLVSVCGVNSGEAISPLIVDLRATPANGWPLAKVRNTETIQLVDQLQAIFGSSPSGPWSDPCDTAVVLPIKSNKTRQPAGLLIAGISARLKFGPLYQNFLELLTAQIATAIAKARAYEEEKNRAQALAEIDHAKTAFFTNISHEFRTPLTLMLGPLEDLLSGSTEVLSPDAANILGLVQRNSVRLLKLVNSLLDFSRIESGRVQANYVPVDLATYTAELASVFRAAIEHTGMHFIIDCPPLPEPVYIDRDMWEKIVLNLISNAFKFTWQGEIEVHMGVADGCAQLTVRDTGVGIPQDEIPRMFDRFYRVPGRVGRTHEGTGIGLALVRELIVLHGGTVSVTSMVGEGSTFKVTVPLGHAHLDPQRIECVSDLASTTIGATAFVEEALLWSRDTEQEQRPRLDASIHRAAEDDQSSCFNSFDEKSRAERARILWVEDNTDMRAYVSRLLGRQFDVEAVADGQAALDAVRRSLPDIVLSDVMMPKMDGFELLRALRNDPSTSEIPVILLSARSGEESRIEGIAAGADDYLIKPFSIRELLARVESNVKMARFRRNAMERLRESENRAAAEAAALTRLNEVNSRLWHVPSLSEGLDVILGSAIEMMGADMGDVQILDADSQVLYIAAQRGFQDDFLKFFREVSAKNDSACAQALRLQKRIMIEDVDTDTAFMPMREAARTAGFRAVQSTPITGNDGTILGIISTHFRSPQRPSEHKLCCLDLYARRAAEFIEHNRTKTDSALLSAIISSSTDAIISKNLDGIITSWNPAAELMFGYTAGEAVGRPITLLIPSDRLSEEAHILGQIKRGERIEHFETVRVRKDGVLLDMSLTVSPVRDANNHIIGASKIARDISNNKRMQATLRQQHEQLQSTLDALRYRTQQFEIIFNRAPLGMFLIDANFRIYEVNPVVQSFFGKTPGDVIGHDFDEIMHSLHDKSFADEIVRIFRHTLETGEPHVTLEHAVIRIDRGGADYYDWRIDRIPLADGRHGVVCYFRDISEQVLTRHAIEQSRAALQESDRRKDEFLAVLAHELRNPLAPLRNGLELLKLADSGSETIRETHALMQRQIEQMIRLVDDLLDVSRISHGIVSLKKERIQLATVLQIAVETSRPGIEDAHHTLVLDIPEEPILIDADKIRLSQVFTNLLNNAVKYTKPGGYLRLAVERRESDALVTIADNGTGIPAHMLTKIFDIFTQVDRSLDQRRPGMGLGLSIAKNLIKMHSGSIEARSAGNGMGSEFIVRIPVITSGVRDMPVNTISNQVGAGLSQRVLVVDDNADATQSMTMMLKLLGHETQAAYNGLEALDVAAEFRPNVVFLDIGMPKLNGYETCRRLRERSWGKSITLIALTGWGQEADKRASRDAGFDHHLVKPIDPMRLQQLLASVRAEMP
ncbi:MAG: ATP-binding protein [Sulfuricaulis sp.]